MIVKKDTEFLGANNEIPLSISRSVFGRSTIYIVLILC